jgi:hypothetical protein
LAKAKTKTAVKAKAPAQKKAPAKAAVVKTAARKVVKPAKAAAPKKAAPRKAAKIPAVEIAVAAKPVSASDRVTVKPVAPMALKAPVTEPVARVALLKAKEPAPKIVEAPKPAPQPIRPAAPIAPAQARADIPPTAGFSLMVDGHFKNQFETLKSARDAAGELKARFPVLRLEIYDGVKKERLPV